MPRFLLRVEGVNHGNVIDDTDDLSTRRGGGLMLLNAVLDESFAREYELTPVATGASVGLFTFEAPDDIAAEVTRARIAKHFLTAKLGELPLERGTFVADILSVGADHAVERAVALNRWRQMQEPTVPFGDLVSQGGSFCHLDRVRPATPGCRIPKDRDHDVSQSVYDRHQYGRQEAKRQFYRQFSGEDLQFTNEFSEVSDRKQLDPLDRRQPTHDKIAVCYLDGNKFGEIGRKRVESCGLKDYQKWSDGVRAHHRCLLESLLKLTQTSAGWTNEGRVRLETLLWGGDEIVWVVPAWKGWELAKWFFGQEHKIDGEAVTYACGLVLCHTKAPIHNVVKLAMRLGDEAKAAGKNSNPTAYPPHRLAYEVLESIDDITSDFGNHRANWLPRHLKPVESQADTWTDPLVLDPAALHQVWPDLEAVAAGPDFPTRQLYRLCKAWRQSAQTPGQEIVFTLAMTAARDRVKKCDVGHEFSRLEAALGGPGVAWLHLLQMLPYVPATGAAR